MTRSRRIGSWFADRLKDLLYSTGNEHLDLARVTAAVFAGLAGFAVYWNAVHLGKELDLAATIGGLAGLATALNIGIAAKEWARKLITQAAECGEKPKP